MKDLLQIDKFRHWLEHHRGDDIVGLMGDPDHCPLATYMREQGQQVCIGSTSLSSPALEFDLPDWAERFTCHVDDTADDEDDAITTRRAIVCMNIVDTEMLIGRIRG